MAVSMPPSGFDDLSVDEQVSYVEALWVRIARQPVPTRDEQKRELDARWARHEADPDTARPWAEVRAELEAKYGLQDR